MTPTSAASMTPVNKKPLISISIPVLNESGNIDALYARLEALGQRMAEKCDLEFVFSDNHSDDRSNEGSADESAEYTGAEF